LRMSANIRAVARTPSSFHCVHGRERAATPSRARSIGSKTLTGLQPERTRMARRRDFVFLLALVAACRGATASVKDVAGAVPPFDQLQSVELGMRVGALQRIRVATPPEPYFGLREPLEEWNVAYRFGDSPDKGPPRGRLKMVMAGRELDAQSPADSVAIAMFDALSQRIGLPDACQRTSGSAMVSLRARWLRMGHVLEVSSIHRTKPIGGDAKTFAVVATVRPDTTGPGPAVVSDVAAAACRTALTERL
jgi:hypothetical protein